MLQLFKEYIDLDEKYLSLICLWIIGASNHKEFISYPYLFFNAMKGSGKTRLLKLITFLCNGSMLNSLREAILFRTNDMLAIDEFEAISRKGSEDLRELLNSAYKKGIKVKRMRKAKTLQGEEQVIEEFEVYRPIVMANISGLENVLEDRCISIILEKSNNIFIINKAEIWEQNPISLKIKEFLSKRCSLCSVVTMQNMYMGWNDYLTLNYTNYTHTHTTQTTQTTQAHIIEYLYKRMYESGIVGRNFELAFPLIFIASKLNKEIIDKTILTFKELIEEKRQEDITESRDVSLIEFISQQIDDNRWIALRIVLDEFKGFLQENDEWMNNKWFGRALKRLSLIKEKRRLNRGIYIILNVQKAQEKIKMFK